MSDPFVTSESDRDDADQKKRFVVEKVTRQPHPRAAVRETKLGLVISLILVCASSGFKLRSKAATNSDKGETASTDEADLRRRLEVCSFLSTSSSTKSPTCGESGMDHQWHVSTEVQRFAPSASRTGGSV